MILMQQKHEILNFSNGMDKLIEEFGRECYQSHHKVTPHSAPKFVKMLIKSGHESVLEHLSITVRMITNRAVTHQIVRHRIAAYSQESQRYCESKDGVAFIIPHWSWFLSPGVYTDESLCEEPLAPIPKEDKFFLKDCLACESNYNRRRNAGMAKEDARGCLTNDVKTSIVATYNIRQWRHIFRERCADPAWKQTRNLFTDILFEFASKWPVLFYDVYKQFDKRKASNENA